MVNIYYHPTIIFSIFVFEYIAEQLFHHKSVLKKLVCFNIIFFILKIFSLPLDLPMRVKGESVPSNMKIERSNSNLPGMKHSLFMSK